MHGSQGIAFPAPVASVNGMTGDVVIPSGGGGDSGFLYQDYEKTVDYVYVGYEHPDGRWFIYRRTIADGSRLYAEDTVDYSTNWATRDSLIYS